MGGMRTVSVVALAVAGILGVSVAGMVLTTRRKDDEEQRPPGDTTTNPPTTFPPAPVANVPPAVYEPEGQWDSVGPVYDMPPIAAQAWPAWEAIQPAIILADQALSQMFGLGAASYNHGPYPYSWLYGESAESMTTPGAYRMVDMYYGTAWNSPLLEFKFGIPPEQVALPTNRLFVPSGYELLQLAPNGEMGPAYHDVIDAFVLQDKDVWRYQIAEPTPVCAKGGYTRAEAEALGYKPSDFVTHETWIRTWCVERGFMVCVWRTVYCAPQSPDWQLFLISPEYFRNLRGFPGIYIVALPYGLASTKENWDRWAKFWA